MNFPPPLLELRLAAPSNYARGRKNHAIKRLVIHTMQGTYHGTAGWFADSTAGTSAHYGVSLTGCVAQYVHDADTAWHAGNSLYNMTSIGIELEGYADKPNFTTSMLEALVKLCKHLCEAYNIPINRDYIIGHCEVPDPKTGKPTGGINHHHDPGPDFPWTQFMTLMTT